MQGTTILFSEMTPPPGRAAEFHNWYDREHIPLRMAVPGFMSARRYRDTAEGAQGFLAVYEMDAPGVLKSAAYGAVKNRPSALTRDMLSNVSGFTRYIGQEIAVRRRADGDAPAELDAPFLYPVSFQVPEERCAEFDAWYEQDHLPLLMEASEWLMVRRFRITDREPGIYNRLALHYHANRSALTSPGREKARATPWRARVVAEPWFRGIYGLFEAVRPRQKPAL